MLIPELGMGPFLLTESNPIFSINIWCLIELVNHVPLTILMLTFNRGKTGIAKFTNHTFKETASSVLQWLLIWKSGVTFIQRNSIQSIKYSGNPDPIQSSQSNPIHEWIQSMSNSGVYWPTEICTWSTFPGPIQFNPVRIFTSLTQPKPYTHTVYTINMRGDSKTFNKSVPGTLRHLYA